MASTTAASRPHSTARWPWRTSSAASALPQEPAPRTAIVRAAVSAMPASGVAGGLGAAAELAGGLLLRALAQALGVQALEVQRLQQERRKTAGLDQFADGLPRVRIQRGRAQGAE